MATDWNVWGTIKQTAALWFRKDGYALKVVPSGTTLTADRTISLPNANADTTLTTSDGIQTLTNKYFDGGTASANNKLKLPSDTLANLTSLADKLEGQLYYATDTDKIYSFDGTNLKVAGGGLLTTPKSFSDGDFTAEVGKHYLVDMTGVNALRTITLPAGAAEAVVRVSVVNNTSTTYPLTIDGNGTEKIFYNATQNLNVNFPYAEQWCELSWDTNDSQWIVNDGSTPLSGTWSGSLDMTGTLKVAGLITADGGIKLGNETLSVYDEGTWTPAYVADSNLSGTPSFGTATYTRIGNTVFAMINGITGLTIDTAAGTYTYLNFSSTGLPGVTNSTSWFGGANVTLNAAPYENLPNGLTDSSGSDTNIFFNIGAASVPSVVNGDAFTIANLYFQYVI